MHAVDLNTVLSVGIAAVLGPVFAWFAFKGLRDGKTGPKGLPASRAASPVLFWTYVVMYGAAATMFVAFAIFIVNYRPDTMSVIETAGLVVSMICFGGVLASVASVTGFHTVQGFRTRTATLVWQGSVDFYSRDERPGWYWATQIQNLLLVAFLGTIGAGAVAIALWFTGGMLGFW